MDRSTLRIASIAVQTAANSFLRPQAIKITRWREDTATGKTFRQTVSRRRSLLAR
jgi:hypothetical protein